MRLVEFIIKGSNGARVMFNTKHIMTIREWDKTSTRIYTKEDSRFYEVEGSYEEVIRTIAEGQRLTNLVKYGLPSNEQEEEM